MGKSKKSSKAVEFEVDDGASTTSTNTMCNGANGLEVLNEDLDVFASCLDDLFEKRGSTREKALQNLNGFLREDVRQDECISNETTLVSRCLNSLRKGSATEAEQAAIVLGLHVVTLGEPSETRYLELEPDLAKAALHGKSPAAKVAAIESLAVACYVSSEDGDSTVRASLKMQEVWQKDASPKVKAAALSAWSFLLTSISNMRTHFIEDALPGLSALLNSSEVDVRKAAGEAISLVYHLTGFAEVMNEQDEDGDTDDMSVSACSSLSAMDDVMDRMKDLAQNRGDKQRRSKRDRKTTRTAFRDICNSIEAGATPEIKIKLQHGDVLVINTIDGAVVLNYLKHYLAGGFQAHLQFNPLMHSIFGFSPLAQRPDRLSALEKRAFRSPSSAVSKARAQSRRQQRSHKGAAIWGAE